MKNSNPIEYIGKTGALKQELRTDSLPAENTMLDRT